MLQRLRGEAKSRDEKALADQGEEPVAASSEIAEQTEGAA